MALIVPILKGQPLKYLVLINTLLPIFKGFIYNNNNKPVFPYFIPSKEKKLKGIAVLCRVLADPHSGNINDI